MTTERSPLQGRRVLLGVTGGIAAYKACILVRLLRLQGASVRVVMTRSAERFVGPATFAALSDHRVYTDLFEEPGVVLHVRLAHEADIAVVAPATANVIAKLAQGIADDLLTSTLLEATCPLVLAPAMHTGMWEHPATQANVNALASRGARIVGPAHGSLAAGDEGTGRMTEPEGIAAGDRGRAVVGGRPRRQAHRRDRGADVGADRPRPLHREPFDGQDGVRRRGGGVRTRGRGHARGRARHRRAPRGSRRGARDDRRRDASRRPGRRRGCGRGRDGGGRRRLPARDLGRATSSRRTWGRPRFGSSRPPTSLLELGSTGGTVLVGFAAETRDVEASGREKLRRKGVQLLVANEVGREGTGFGSDTNRAAILAADGEDVGMREWTKRELAAAICDRLAKLLTT